MRVRVLSDLHIEFGGPAFPEHCGEDLVVLAGDIGEGAAGLEWAVQAFPRVPIIYVPGNHEYYDADYESVRATMRDAASALGAGRIILLDDGATTIDGIRVIGSTAWTDFRLFGSAPEEVARAMATCKRNLLDFRHIRTSGMDGKARFIEPEDTVMWHRRARQYLGLALASGDPARTIVVTHHGPHRKSLAPRFANDLTSAAFIADLSALVPRAKLWIHGHTHTSFDYTVGPARVVCNPRGYCRADGTECENDAFRWDYLVEV